MSLRSSASNARFGNVGVFSVAVIAFALATLQGCAAPAVGGSPAKEPGSFPAGLGALGRDNPPAAAARQAAERNVSERASGRAREPRTYRMEYCRRCNGT